METIAHLEILEAGNEALEKALAKNLAPGIGATRLVDTIVRILRDGINDMLRRPNPMNMLPVWKGGMPGGAHREEIRKRDTLQQHVHQLVRHRHEAMHTIQKWKETALRQEETSRELETIKACLNEAMGNPENNPETQTALTRRHAEIETAQVLLTLSMDAHQNEISTVEAVVSKLGNPENLMINLSSATGSIIRLLSEIQNQVEAIRRQSRQKINAN